MLYIVEGCDKTGKSTFSKKLAENLKAKYMHFSKPDTDPQEYFFPAFSSHLDGNTVVCDRYVLGEKIYAKVKKEDSQWKDGAYDEMLLRLEQSGNVVLIVCWEYPGTLKKRFEDEGETYITAKQGLKVQKLFIKEAQRIADTYPGILVMKYKPTTNCLRILSPRV